MKKITLFLVFIAVAQEFDPPMFGQSAGPTQIGSVQVPFSATGGASMAGTMTIKPTSPESTMMNFTNPANTNGVIMLIATNAGSLVIRGSGSNQNGVIIQGGTNATNTLKLSRWTGTNGIDMGWFDEWGDYVAAGNITAGTNLYVPGLGTSGMVSVGAGGLLGDVTTLPYSMLSAISGSGVHTFLSNTGSAFVWANAPSSGGGSGTVTSVTVDGDGTMMQASSGGSPITASGTITLALANADANTVFANTSSSSTTPAYVPYANIAAPPFTNCGWDLGGTSAKMLTFAGQTSGAANTVYFMMDTIPSYTPITNVIYKITANSSGELFAEGIYPVNPNGTTGTKLYDTGPITLGTSTSFVTNAMTNSSLGGGILPPGVYAMVWTSHNASLPIEGAAIGISIDELSAAPMMGTAANNSTSGQLPNTLGALTGASTFMPMFHVGP